MGKELEDEMIALAQRPVRTSFGVVSPKRDIVIERNVGQSIVEVDARGRVVDDSAWEDDGLDAEDDELDCAYDDLNMK